MNFYSINLNDYMEVFLSKDINRKIIIEKMNKPENTQPAQSENSAGKSPIKNKDDSHIPQTADKNGP